jgi:hypothetical protein
MERGYSPHQAVPLPLLEETGKEARLWALGNGLLMLSEFGVDHAPIAISPSPFSRTLFEQAVNLAPTFNRLVHIAANDQEFICNALKRLVLYNF